MNLIEMYGVLWNSSEGHASIVMDAMACSLSNLLESVGNLPEFCIK